MSKVLQMSRTNDIWLVPMLKDATAQLFPRPHVFAKAEASGVWLCGGQVWRVCGWSCATATACAMRWPTSAQTCRPTSCLRCWRPPGTSSWLSCRSARPVTAYPVCPRCVMQCIRASALNLNAQAKCSSSGNEKTLSKRPQPQCCFRLYVMPPNCQPLT